MNRGVLKMLAILLCSLAPAIFLAGIVVPPSAVAQTIVMNGTRSRLRRRLN